VEHAGDFAANIVRIAAAGHRVIYRLSNIGKCSAAGHSSRGYTDVIPDPEAFKFDGSSMIG
jgi:hypothetical protein